MLDNRAKPRSSPRGCGAANALLTACARYGIWEGGRDGETALSAEQRN